VQHVQQYRKHRHNFVADVLRMLRMPVLKTSRAASGILDNSE